MQAPPLFDCGLLLGQNRLPMGLVGQRMLYMNLSTGELGSPVWNNDSGLGLVTDIRIGHHPSGWALGWYGECEGEVVLLSEIAAEQGSPWSYAEALAEELKPYGVNVHIEEKRGLTPWMFLHRLNSQYRRDGRASTATQTSDQEKNPMSTTRNTRPSNAAGSAKPAPRTASGKKDATKERELPTGVAKAEDVEGAAELGFTTVTVWPSEPNPERPGFLGFANFGYYRAVIRDVAVRETKESGEIYAALPARKSNSGEWRDSIFFLKATDESDERYVLNQLIAIAYSRAIGSTVQ